MLVYMVQVNQYTWEIRSYKGFVIQTGISLPNVTKAKEYVKNYITSFQGWEFELKLLKQ